MHGIQEMSTLESHTSRSILDLMRMVLLSAFLLLCTSACSSPPEARQQTIDGMLDVPGGRIYYELSNPEAEGIPLLLIHGGPGGTSCGFGLLDDLILDRPVIRYDQLETGKSDRPGNRENWNIGQSVAEIEAIREVMGLDELHILGLSWGGSVAAEYGLEGDTTGVHSIILGGPLLSTPIWLEDAAVLVSEMPLELQNTIRLHENAGTYSHPDYVAATDSFYSRFLYHQPEKDVPECQGVRGNSEVYNTMWGPTEFASTGTLLNFDRTDRLHELNMPVLFIAGEFDEARPETMHRFASLVPNAEVEIIADAGHMAMVDKPEEYAAVVSSYLRSIEQ